MTTSKTIVFFGSGPVAAQSLEFLVAHFKIEAVVTKPVPAHHKDAAPVEIIARRHNLTTVFAGNKKELDDLIDSHDFMSDLGIIIDYGVIVSQTVIDTFPLGIINSHFSLLPEWRGADPITFSILSGQAKTGVSLMIIDASLDTGKLLIQKGLEIGLNETAPTLTNKLITLSNQLLKEFVPRYQMGEVVLKSQPHPDRATYSRKLTKQDGAIDWNKPASIIEREIRAFNGWPQSRTTLGKVEVIITAAHAMPFDAHTIGGIEVIEDAQTLRVGTGEGSLYIDMLKPIGKKEMPVQAFLRGYHSHVR